MNLFPLNFYIVSQTYISISLSLSFSISIFFSFPSPSSSPSEYSDSYLLVKPACIQKEVHLESQLAVRQKFKDNTKVRKVN